MYLIISCTFSGTVEGKCVLGIRRTRIVTGYSLLSSILLEWSCPFICSGGFCLVPVIYLFCMVEINIRTLPR